MTVPVLPNGLEAYRRTAEFTEATIPAALRKAHRTRDAAWGVIHVLEGEIVYRITDPRRPHWEQLLSPKTPPAVIEPTIEHEVEPCGPVRFFVEFYRRLPAAEVGKR